MEELQQRSRRLLVWVWSCCTIFLCGLTIADPDLWGHTLYGLRAINAGILTETTDPFSYTAPNAEWINHEWLTELIYGVLWKAGGGLALVCWRNLIVVGLMIFAGVAIRRSRCGLGTGIMLLVFNVECLAEFVVFVRPQLMTFLLFATFLTILSRYFQSPTRWVWLLPPLTALWVNLHGGFLAGVGITGLYTLGAIVRFARQRNNDILDTEFRHAAIELSIIGILCLAATLWNPYGWRMHAMLWDHLWVKQLVREWQPIWRAGNPVVNHTPLLVVGYVFLLAGPMFRASPTANATTTGTGSETNEQCESADEGLQQVPTLDPRDRLGWMESVVLAVICWQAAAHLRHIALLCIAIMILLPRPLNYALKRTFPLLIERWATKRGLTKSTLGVISVCVFLGLIQIRGSVQLWKAGVAPWELAVECDSFVPGMPTRAVEFLVENNVDGNLITDYGWGQFLIWHRFPQNRVAFDGRYRTVYSPRLEKEFVEFHQVSHAVKKPASEMQLHPSSENQVSPPKQPPPKGSSPHAGRDRLPPTPMLDGHPTEIALVPVGRIPDKYLTRRTDWICVYRDQQASVYLKRIAKFERLIATAESNGPAAKSTRKWVEFPGPGQSGTPVASKALLPE